MGLAVSSASEHKSEQRFQLNGALNRTVSEYSAVKLRQYHLLSSIATVDHMELASHTHMWQSSWNFFSACSEKRLRLF